MKRPFAVIGFSMLLSSLFATNLTIKSAIIVLTTIMAIFCAFLIFKSLRKYKIIIFSCVAVALYVISFAFAQYGYYNATQKFSNPVEIKGVVCQTPTQTDYTYNYVIRLENKNFKIRYSSQENKMFTQGDVVSGTVMLTDEIFQDEFFDNSLSSKIYFTFFEGKESNLEKTGETSTIYKTLGSVKVWFTNVIDMYLPGENGAIAKAMTIGDKSEIDSKTINYFNYAGTSHLLVISGLHLTLWSVGIMKFAEKFSKTRKYTAPIGIFCLLFYSALTGFSVSVIRAGAMVGVMLVAKAFRRDADSINSIGIALTFIMLSNPFAVFSASLWFTVASTMGILVVAQKLILMLKKHEQTYPVIKNGLVSTIITTIIISVATTIFTLPVFVLKFQIMPVASILSNLLMIDLAMVMMILTVLGAFMHLVGFAFLSEGIYAVVGFIGNFLSILAEKIGMAEWSTISVSNECYTYFLYIAIVCIIVAISFKKYKDILLKTVSIALSVVFVLMTLCCVSFDYSNVSVDVISTTKDTQLILVNYGGGNLLIGAPSTEYNSTLREFMNTHNRKTIDNVTESKI